MILINLLLALHTAFASGNGNVVKNGGDYVICQNGPKTSEVYVEHRAIFDIFEGSEYWKFNYKKLATYRGKDFASTFSSAVRRFFNRSPQLQNELLNQFSQFSKNVRFTKNLPDIGLPNFSWTSLMNGCEVRRIAVQSVVPYSPQSPVLIEIDSEAWKQIGTDQKIALLVHEYIEAVFFRYVGSCIYSRTQLAVSRLLSDEADSMSLNDWNRVLRFNCEGNTRPDGTISADDP